MYAPRRGWWHDICSSDMRRYVPGCTAALILGGAVFGCSSDDNVGATNAASTDGAVRPNVATVTNMVEGGVAEASAIDKVEGGIADVPLVEASPPRDVDSSIGALSCELLEEAWHDFVALPSMCTTDDDCIGFEWPPGAITCDCPDGLQATISRAELSDAQLYADRYEEVCQGRGIWTDFGCDGSPLLNTRCVNGSCTSDTESCLVGFYTDAGDAGD
jgi:hypothetical protein